MKSKYKVIVYMIDDNAIVSKIIEHSEDKPHINDYANYFAPKLSTCYSIQFFELQQDNCYKMFESWIKSRKGWKKIPCLI